MCLKECGVVIPVDGEESSSDDEDDEDDEEDDEDEESRGDNREGEDDHKEELEKVEEFSEEEDVEQTVDEKARVLRFLYILELITASRPRYVLRRIHSWAWQKTPLDLLRICLTPLFPVKL